MPPKKIPVHHLLISNIVVSLINAPIVEAVNVSLR